MRFNLAKYIGLLTIAMSLRFVFEVDFTFVQWIFMVLGLNLISFEMKSKCKEEHK